jgi:hypothetical protein
MKRCSMDWPDEQSYEALLILDLESAFDETEDLG